MSGRTHTPRESPSSILDCIQPFPQFSANLLSAKHDLVLVRFPISLTAHRPPSPLPGQSGRGHCQSRTHGTCPRAARQRGRSAPGRGCRGAVPSARAPAQGPEMPVERAIRVPSGDTRRRPEAASGGWEAGVRRPETAPHPGRPQAGASGRDGRLAVAADPLGSGMGCARCEWGTNRLLSSRIPALIHSKSFY